MKGVKRVSKKSFWFVGMVLVLAATLLTGCPGPTDPPKDDPGLPDKVEITQPQDKAVFNIETDADKSAPGIQISLEVKVTADSTKELPKGLKGRVLINNRVVKEIDVSSTTIKFDGLTLEEGTNSIQAVLEFDGKTQNSNAILVTADSKCYQIQFALPKDKQVFGTNDDADANQTGFQTDVEVQVDPSAQEEIELEIVDKGGQSTKVTAKPFGGKATFSKVTLPPGEVTLTARITDPVGNKCSDQITVSINTAAPTVTITAPTANKQFCPTDDVDTNTAGFQVDVTATTTAGDGSLATLWVNGKQEGNETAITGNAVSFQITLPGQFTSTTELQVKVKDKLGNEGASTPTTFDAISQGYSIRFINVLDGQTIVTSRDEDKVKPGLQLTVNMSSSLPDGESITLVQDQEAPQQIKVANGAAAVQLNLKEGQNCITVTVKEPKCSTETSAKVCLTVQPFGVPTLTCTLEKGPAFVKDEANINTSHDTDTVKAGVQNGIKCRSDAEKDQDLAITLNGNSQLVKLAEVTGIREASVSGLDFNEGVNTLAVKVTNLAGKSTTLNLTVNVDTTPPEAITDLAGAVDDNRKASVKLTWTAPKDGGTGGSGVTQYEIRWSSVLTTIAQAEWGKPEGKLNTPSAVAAGQQVTITVDKLSVGKTYVFAVRAKDASNNLGKISNIIKTTVDFKSTSSSEPSGSTASQYGFNIAAVGDLDKDGKQDVVVCASKYQAGTKIKAGAAFIYYGRDVKTGGFFNTTPDVTITGDNASEEFCQSVTAMGDLNGDGFSDFAVLSFPSGKGYIFFGGTRGTSLKNGTANGLARVIISGVAAEGFAAKFLAVGINGDPDVNGDNKADLVIAAPLKNHGTFKGSLYVFYSRATYPQAGQPALALTTATADLEIINDTEPGSLSFFGFGLAAGDINGDKSADILIASTRANTVLGLYGPLKPATGKTVKTSAITTRFTIKGGANENNNFGSSLSIVGDINKDGTKEIVINSRSADVGASLKAGITRLFSGKILSNGASLKDTDAVLVWNGKAVFLDNVSPAGDINGDGFDDFLLGEGGATDPNNTTVARSGAVYLFFGRAFANMKGGDPATTADVIWYGSQTKAGLGWYGLIGGLDLTGDGFPDILMAETPPLSEKLGGKIILKY